MRSADIQTVIKIFAITIFVVATIFFSPAISFTQNSNQKYNEDGFDKQPWYLNNKDQQTLAQEDSNFTLLGRWAWGACRAMAITGNYALVGQGWMYQVYDISDPLKPTVVYDTIMEGPVVDIKIKDTLLFVLLPSVAIIYDARSLYPLIEYGRYYTDGGIALRDMTVSDSILYLMGRGAGVIAVNISDLSKPYFKWYFPYGLDNPSTITSKGKYVYYGALGPWWPVMYVIEDVPDSTAPRFHGIWMYGNAVAVHLRDTILFASNTFGRLFIFSISDPWNPTTIDSIEINSRVYSMGSKGDNLYCSTIDSGIVVVNISDISNPRIITHHDQGPAKKISCSDNVLGIAGYISFSFFNIQTTDSIDKYIELPVAVNTLDIVLKGKLGFIASGDNGIWSVDFSDPSNPTPIANLPINGYSTDIKISGDILCVLTKKVEYGVPDSLILIKYDDSGGLNKLSAIEVEDNTVSIAISDSLVIIGADSVIGIYSIADVLIPCRLSTISIDGIEIKVSINGNILAAGNHEFNAGIRLYDISIPSMPRLINLLEMRTIGLLLEDTLLFADSSGCLNIYNVSDIQFIKRISSTAMNVSESRSKFIRDGNILYHIGSTTGLGIIDISDIAQPFEYPRYLAIVFWPSSIFPLNDTLYFLTYTDGVWIFKNKYINFTEENAVRLPTSFSLKENYPNPFNPSTSIEYQIPNKCHVTIKIYDLLGREILTLVDETKQAGIHKVKWDASTIPAGVYFYRITTDKYTQTKKMLLIH